MGFRRLLRDYMTELNEEQEVVYNENPPSDVQVTDSISAASSGNL